MIFSYDSLNASPSSLGASFKGKNWLLWGANSFFKSNPQISSDTINTIKVKNKNHFL